MCYKFSVAVVAQEDMRVTVNETVVGSISTRRVGKFHISNILQVLSWVGLVGC